MGYIEDNFNIFNHFHNPIDQYGYENLLFDSLTDNISFDYNKIIKKQKKYNVEYDVTLDDLIKYYWNIFVKMLNEKDPVIRYNFFSSTIKANYYRNECINPLYLWIQQNFNNNSSDKKWFKNMCAKNGYNYGQLSDEVWKENEQKIYYNYINYELNNLRDFINNKKPIINSIQDLGKIINEYDKLPNNIRHGVLDLFNHKPINSDLEHIQFKTFQFFHYDDSGASNKFVMNNIKQTDYRLYLSLKPEKMYKFIIEFDKRIREKELSINYKYDDSESRIDSLVIYVNKNELKDYYEIIKDILKTDNYIYKEKINFLLGIDENNIGFGDEVINSSYTLSRSKVFSNTLDIFVHKFIYNNKEIFKKYVLDFLKTSKTNMDISNTSSDIDKFIDTNICDNNINNYILTKLSKFFTACLITKEDVSDYKRLLFDNLVDSKICPQNISFNENTIKEYYPKNNYNDLINDDAKKKFSVVNRMLPIRNKEYFNRKLYERINSEKKTNPKFNKDDYALDLEIISSYDMLKGVYTNKNKSY